MTLLLVASTIISAGEQYKTLDRVMMTTDQGFRGRDRHDEHSTTIMMMMMIMMRMRRKMTTTTMMMMMMLLKYTE